MELISKMEGDNRLIIAVLAIILIIILTIKYKKGLYYTVEGEDAQKHPLNKKYNLNNKKRLLDVKKINKQLYTFEVVTTLISAIVMVMVDIMLGFILYVFIMYTGSRELHKRIYESYSRL